MAQQPGAAFAQRSAVRTTNPPNDLPRSGYVRESTVLRFIPFGRSTLWAKAKRGEFPRPVKISQRVTAWRAEDIWTWIEARDQVGHA